MAYGVKYTDSGECLMTEADMLIRRQEIRQATGTIPMAFYEEYKELGKLLYGEGHEDSYS